MTTPTPPKTSHFFPNLDKADRETKALLHWVSSSKGTPVSSLSPQIARENYKQSLAKTDIPAPTVHAIENITLQGQGGDVPLRIYRPLGYDENTPYPAILFSHGGGCVFGDLDTHEPLCAMLCADNKAIVIAIEYRIAPEHLFPAPVEDGISALTWLVNNTAQLNIDPNRIALAGDSAGGGMATTVIQECKNILDFTPCAQLLIYPAIDITARFPSRTTLSDAFPINTDTLEWFYSQYFGATWPLYDKRCHPLYYENFANVPTLIMTAGLDPLHDEAIAYGQKMEATGVPVQYIDYEGTIHGFLGMGKLLRTSFKKARQDMAHFLKAQFSV